MIAKVMLDTNLFDGVMDGSFDLGGVSGRIVVATHVQQDEIAAIPSPEKRDRLLKVFGETVQELQPTSVAVWDVSKFDESNFGTNQHNTLFEKMRLELQKRDKKAKSQWKNQSRDALIAVTSIANEFVLFTADEELSKVVKYNGGNAVWLPKGKRVIGND